MFYFPYSVTCKVPQRSVGCVFHCQYHSPARGANAQHSEIHLPYRCPEMTMVKITMVPYPVKGDVGCQPQNKPGSFSKRRGAKKRKTEITLLTICMCKHTYIHIDNVCPYIHIYKMLQFIEKICFAPKKQYSPQMCISHTWSLWFNILKNSLQFSHSVTHLLCFNKTYY